MYTLFDFSILKNTYSNFNVDCQKKKGRVARRERERQWKK